MKHLFVLLVGALMCCVSMTAHASQRPQIEEMGHLIGHVMDDDSRQYLIGATITLRNTRFSATTDATGHYFIKDLPAGRYTIDIAYLGYQSLAREVEIKAGATLTENFELLPEGVNLRDVVVSATRNETKRKLAPALVHVLDGKLFERTQSTDLSQSLKFQPGVRVEGNCQNCGFYQVRINGLEGPYSQILIDSRPVLSSLAGVYGIEQIPTNMIERVEVMRGGGSALFGSSAIAGVINVITKEPTSPAASISHDIRGIGGLSRFENVTNMNATLVTDNNRMGATLFGQVRHRSAYDANGDGYSETPVLDARNLGFRAFAKFSTYSKLTAEFHNLQEYRRGGDLLHLEPHNAHIAEQLTHNNTNGSLNFSAITPNSRHRVNLYASFMKVDRKSYYGGGESTAAELLEKSLHQPLTEQEKKDLKLRLASYGKTNGLTTLLGGQYAYDFDRLLFMPAQLTIGAEHTRDTNDDNSGFRPTPIAQRVNIASAFAQNEWRTDRWSLLLGGRLDKHSLISHAIFSPRANVRYNPTRNLVLRANYSAGFRAPQIFDEDLHVDNAGGELILAENDPNLREERSNSLSASADWYVAFGQWQLNLTAEGFYTELRHAFSSINQDAEQNGVKYTRKLRINTPGATVAGANLEARLSFRNVWSLQGGMTLQQSRWKEAQQWHEDDTYTTRRMYRTPNVYGYFVSTYSPTKRLDLTLSGTFTGSMLAGHEIVTDDAGQLAQFDGAPASDVRTERLMMGPGQTATTYGPRTMRTPAFFELGFKVQYTFPIYRYYSLTLNAGVQNLLNAYQTDFDRGPSRDSAYIYGPNAPRSLFAGIKVAF